MKYQTKNKIKGSQYEGARMDDPWKHFLGTHMEEISKKS